MAQSCDVLVVGTGNAALVAALGAHERGARVAIIERAPEEALGGNSYFTMGCFRMALRSADDMRRLIPDLSDSDFEAIAEYPYTAELYYRDLMRASDGLADPGLTRLLVDQSLPVVEWMRSQGVEWELPVQKLPRGLTRRQVWRWAPGVWARGEGRGLVTRLLEATRRADIPIRYRTGAEQLILDDTGGVRGLRVKTPSGFEDLSANAVILACGGFEASSEMRTRYLGPDWANIRVRGTRYNTGVGLRMALDAGARSHGDWGGAHAIPIDGHAPHFGDRSLGERTRRCLYQFGIMVDREGHRFVDEGEDLTVHTYAKTGIAIQRQRGQTAWQIFDVQWEQAPVERDFYALTTPVVGETIAELAARTGIPAGNLEGEVARYNAAVDESRRFDPTTLDGRGAPGLAPPRTNWARKIEKPPFVAFPVAGGITFSYGGIAIDHSCRVLDAGDVPIPGLYAAGEMTGGFFYRNYFGGAGLMRGAVTGRLAGLAAGDESRGRG